MELNIKKMNFKKLSVLIAFSLIFGLFASCNKDESLATVSFTELGADLSGDVNGDGGSTQRSFKWNNSLSTVDYNMDITATSGGSFTLRLDDADGTNVLNETLQKGQGDDSKSGVSAAGTPGEWTVTVTLTNFNGDGSFSISPGN